jgi:hypothetical protein
MGKDIIGSIKKFTVEGISYRVSADANIKRRPTNVENAMLPTSGNSMQQKKRIVPQAEGIDLSCNAEEMDTLKSFAEGLDLVKVSYTTAAGDVYRCKGQINIEGHESETGKVTVTVMPVSDWTTFAA